MEGIELNESEYGKKFECHICLQKFGSKGWLTKHLATHEGQIEERKLFRCKFCWKTFIWKTSLTAHTRIMHVKIFNSQPHNKNQLKYSNFSQISNSSVCLSKHISHLKEKQSCKETEIVNPTKMEIINVDEISNEKEPLECYICCRKFESKSGLTRHTNSHIKLNRRMKEKRHMGNICSDRVRFECKICGSTLKQVRSFYTHLRRSHLNDL